MNANNFWGIRIKQIRTKTLKLSQEELAKEIGCSQVNIAAIEQGTTGKFFIILLAYLTDKDINLNWVFKKDNSFEPIQNEERLF